MPYSTCCGAHTTMEEIGICPDCLEHCDWEDEEEEETPKEELEQDRETDRLLDQEKINKYDKE
ncbi:MAG: hypothetical protein ACOYKI_03505 [Sediminibacterium sp.]